MSVELDSAILEWIDEESHDSAAGTVAMQLLMLRLALLQHQGLEQDGARNWTRSVELSLNEFDRATFYRIIRSLVRKGFVRLTRGDGSLVGETEIQELQQCIEESRLAGFLSLTDTGKLEVTRLKMLNPIAE